MKSGAHCRFLDRSAAALLRRAGLWAIGLGSLLCVVIGAGMPDPAWGQFSSGGYKRPGGFPSYSAPIRRPPVSSSGGYTRRAPSGPVFTGRSPGDRAMSRGVSSKALRDYQAGQRPPETYARRPPPAGGDGGWGADRGWGSATTRRPPVWGEWWGGATARRQFPGSGILTTVALWAALNALSSPGQAEYFNAHRNDPVYQEWRREAEQRAARDPEVAAKLRQLDTRLTQLEGAPRGPSARPAAAPEAGSGAFWPVLFVGVGVLVLFWLWRRRAAAPAAAAATGAPGLGGSAASRFRVGMVLPVDPAPFLLAAGLTKIQAPEESGTISVETVGLLRYGDVLLHRLYLPGGKAFFQLHLDPDGRPDECRFFSVIDELAPAGAQEWAFWLDPAQGMIGWPSFQTKDGKVYGRAWAPGDSRIAPRDIEETQQHLDRVEQRRLQAMLYGAPTGGALPAPDTEYILVSAVEAGGQAWVEIDAGIDINPAALNLPGVPLAP